MTTIIVTARLIGPQCESFVAERTDATAFSLKATHLQVATGIR